MSAESVLVSLASTCAQAAADALRRLVPDAVDVGPVRVVAGGADLLANPSLPAIAADAAYVDDVTGGNVVVVPLAAARSVALAMLGMPEPAAADDAPLDEFERSAVAEAVSQTMAAAASATSEALGSDVGIAPPRIRDLVAPADVEGLGRATPHVTVVPLTVSGHVCLLVQYIPEPFVVRLTGAPDGSDADGSDADVRSERPAADRSPEGLATALGGAEVDLWVELGRARMPAGRLAGMPAGEVLALDRLADDPVDLYVNGLRVGTGRLLVVDGSEWGVRIEAMHDADAEPVGDAQP